MVSTEKKTILKNNNVCKTMVLLLMSNLRLYVQNLLCCYSFLSCIYDQYSSCFHFFLSPLIIPNGGITNPRHMSYPERISVFCTRGGVRARDVASRETISSSFPSAPAYNSSFRNERLYNPLGRTGRLSHGKFTCLNFIVFRYFSILSLLYFYLSCVMVTASGPLISIR